MLKIAMLVIVLLLLAILLPGAASAQSAADCIQVRAQTPTALRFYNTCSSHLNVQACCRGEGNLVSCESSQFRSFEIGPGLWFALPRCDGWVWWLACEAPYLMQGATWNSNQREIVGGSCGLPPAPLREVACEDISGQNGQFESEITSETAKMCLYVVGDDAIWLDVRVDEVCPSAIHCL